jgi:hypothetical protein
MGRPPADNLKGAVKIFAQKMKPSGRTKKSDRKINPDSWPHLRRNDQAQRAI